MITTDNCKDIVDLLKRDEYISDRIDIKINSKISVSALYEEISRDRFEQISKALTEKYRNTQAINEKIDSLTGKYAVANLTA